MGGIKVTGDEKGDKKGKRHRGHPLLENYEKKKPDDLSDVRGRKKG